MIKATLDSVEAKRIIKNVLKWNFYMYFPK